MFISRRLSFTEIPLVDISPIIGGNSPARRAMDAALIDACERVGFFYVTNHRVAEDIQQRMMRVTEDFFALPIEAKMDVVMTKSPAFRGYRPFGSLGVDKTKKARGQEGFQIQRELGADDPDVKAGKPLHAPNLWPKEQPELRKVMLEYYAAMEALSMELMRAFARGLGLEENYFDQRHRKSLSMLRILHYPRHKATDESEIGIRAHTDSGELTIILQDDVGGLEVLNKEGEWVQARPVPGSFIVNLGRAMETWTNGRFVATPHRVINRDGDNRYSMPFFTNPDYDAIVAPVPGTEGYGDAHPPMLAGENTLAQYRKSWPAFGDGGY